MENWEDLLLTVEKPSRYLGAEVNAVRKGREAEFRMVLAFPDAYEVGMSHLGIQILYTLLNSIRGVAAERCFAPWSDMEAELRRRRLPLTTLESRRPLSSFDMIGFSLQYELSYTNVLNMLELGGIPLLRRDRKNTAPLVIAGGPCAFNPAPMEAFIDAFVIGEGEEAAGEIAACCLEAKRKGRSREDTLAALADIEGIYVPGIQDGGKKIGKRTVPDLDEWRLPVEPVVPLMKTIHDRITLEIARGCTRGCRFCQAGMVWRPVRERKQEVVEGMADSLLCSTGYSEISLLSLSSGDYSRIEPLLATLMERYSEKRVALALPSLRAETLTRRLMETIRRVRKTSFTLAPEAGTQRLRNVINKGNSEAELLATVGQIFEAGWKSLKLYFMIGLPGERQEDLEGIVDLAYRTLQETKRRGQITLSLSTFAPKAHTPFQWQEQIGIDEIKEKQDFLKNRVRNRNIGVKWHDSRMSMLEGLFSRGDEETGLLIREAFRLGCRFDGWADRLRFDLWEEAMARTGIDRDACLGRRESTRSLPWDRIDCGVDKGFLLKEEAKALSEETTADCRFGSCQDCGVCDHRTIKIVTASPPLPREDEKDTARLSNAGGESSSSLPKAEKRLLQFRLKFCKENEARFLSHLEIVEALIRAVNRSGLSFAYSQGYHPHPRISFAFATSVGMESKGEYADIMLESAETETAGLEDKVNAFLPGGLQILEALPLMEKEMNLSALIRGFRYDLFLPKEALSLPLLQKKIGDFLHSRAFIIDRETKGKKVKKDVRPLICSMYLDEEKAVVSLEVKISPAGTVRPSEVLTRLLGLSEETAKTARIVKIETVFH